MHTHVRICSDWPVIYSQLKLVRLLCVALRIIHIASHYYCSVARGMDRRVKLVLVHTEIIKIN